MQRLHLKWFTAHGPVAMAALLGVIALVSLFLGLANQRALDWISHTSQVQRSLSSLSTSLIDALQAERLYILTGDDDSLANRLRAQTAVLDQLELARRLTLDNLAQRQRFTELKPLIERRFATGQAVIDARRPADSS